MDSLAWGDSTTLRAELISALRTLPSTDQARRSIDLVLAVRFRRTASQTDGRVPRDYAYAVDIALPSTAPEQIQDLLNSRKPDAAVRYDFVRARLWMPAGVRITVAAADTPVPLDQPGTTSAAAPMMLELVTNDGGSLFGQGADKIADALGVVDLVRTLSPSTLAATPMDVIVGLTSGVNRDYALWTPRPANLFRTLELPMAVLRALDGPTSPCAVVARAHRLFALQHGKTPLLVDYQPVLESALPPDATTATASLTLNVSFPTILRIERLPGKIRFANTPGVLASVTTSYLLANPIAATPEWDQRLAISVTGTKAYDQGALVLPIEVGNDQKIVADATTILAELMQLRAPFVPTDRLDLAQLLLVRIQRLLRPYLPAAVIEEFVSLAVGRWSYYFMTGNFELPATSSAATSFWFEFCYALTSHISPTKATVLTEISRQPAAFPVPAALSAMIRNPDANLHPDYMKLGRAAVYFLLPVYGRFV